MTVTKKILNSVLSLTFSSIAISALADSNYHQGSSYLSGNLGVSFHDHEKNKNALKSRYKEEGLAGRVAVGYTLNKTFSTELGYGRYHTVDYTYSFAPVAPATVGSNLKGKVKYRAADLLVKAILPVGDALGLYLEGGPAYVMAKSNSAFAGDKDFWTPEYGTGVLFNVSEDAHLQGQVGVRHLNGRDHVADVNFAFLGVNVLFN